MASVTNVSNSYSSIYGNRNVLTGLASGMDTETMIENAVSGYQTKIQQLQQQQTKLQWKQDAYRSLTDQLIALSTRYSSYTSSTNLYSPSFFKQYIVSAVGKAADAIVANGKSSSDVTIKSIEQLATASKYTISGKDIGMLGSMTGSLQMDTGNISSSSNVSVTVDGMTKTYNLTDLGLKKGSSNQDVVDKLNGAVAKDFGEGKLTFKLSGDKFAIDGNSSAISKGNSLVSVSTNSPYALGFNGTLSNYVDTNATLGQLMGGNAWEIDKNGNCVKQALVINGVTVGQFDRDTSLADVISAINQSDAGVTAGYSTLTGEFSLIAKETGSGGKIEFGDGLARNLFEPKGTSVDVKLGSLSQFDVDGFWDEDGNAEIYLAGKWIGKFNKDNTLQDLYDMVNVRGFQSKVTKDADGNVQVERKDSGAIMSDDVLNNYWKITNGKGVAVEKPASLFNGMKNTPKGTYTTGNDAIVNVTVNGKDMQLIRASNTIDIDGMSVTLKDTFTEDEGPITFESKIDTESIISGIKAFVNEYNTIINQLHEAFTTQPLEKNSSTHAKYEPLTDEDMESMSDSAIERYEEQAKTGLLFGDRDLSSLYNKMVSMVSSLVTSKEFKDLGITTSYDSNTRMSTVEIDEGKLAAALESNPDKVASFFTRESDNDANRGLINRMKDTLEAYVSTSRTEPGILVRKAGTTQSSNSLTNNALQDQIDAIAKKITTWQAKMSDKIDYYTRQFTALEKLVAEMNNQSSALAGLMGGY